MDIIIPSGVYRIYHPPSRDELCGKKSYNNRSEYASKTVDGRQSHCQNEKFYNLRHYWSTVKLSVVGQLDLLTREHAIFSPNTEVAYAYIMDEQAINCFW